MAKPIEDTGWQQPEIVEGVGGVISNPTATEAKPCWACKRWEKDDKKLIEYVVAHGMKLQDDGTYIFEAIAGDLPTRQQMRLDPKTMGYCRSLCCLAHMDSTCDNWAPRLFAADMAGLTKKR
jgi:hypothetical protein